MAHLGNTIVNGALRVLGEEYVDAINGVTVGSSPKFTDTTYSAGTGTTIGSGNTINVTYGSGANTACQGNDGRLSDNRFPSNNSSLIHTTGNETLAGQKKFTGELVIPVNPSTTPTTNGSIWITT